MASIRAERYCNTRVDIVENTMEDRATKMHTASARRSTYSASGQTRTHNATEAQRELQRRRARHQAELEARIEAQRHGRKIEDHMRDLLARVHDLNRLLIYDAVHDARQRELAARLFLQFNAVEETYLHKLGTEHEDELQVLAESTNGNSLELAKSSYIKQRREYEYELAYDPGRELNMTEASEYGSEDEDASYQRPVVGDPIWKLLSSNTRTSSQTASKAVLGDATNALEQRYQVPIRSGHLPVTAGSMANSNRTPVSAKTSLTGSVTSATRPSTCNKDGPALGASRTRLSPTRRVDTTSSKDDRERGVKSLTKRTRTHPTPERHDKDKDVVHNLGHRRASLPRPSILHSLEGPTGDAPVRTPERSSFRPETSSPYMAKFNAHSTSVTTAMKQGKSSNLNSIHTNL
ncbi:hypothetical protein WOLCODRAFT_165255 [Wolfiporia cocos MD-104 SS10]|uniref:Uncharacterized protein n=1 Tax=Wolfiporia cocos (strain MD-104) TaxID=742152 RepID=A0A2H3K810_WOLCO|nr:hypothetical protein WOLCODRAFT_165255 [Wolfiporia cocos MD-104 SS10]